MNTELCPLASSGLWTLTAILILPLALLGTPGPWAHLIQAKRLTRPSRGPAGAFLFFSGGYREEASL